MLLTADLLGETKPALHFTARQGERLVTAVACFHFPRQQLGRKNVTLVARRQASCLSSRPPSALWEKWGRRGVE